jgi:hypothetical protein
MYLAWHAQHDNPALDAFLQRVAKRNSPETAGSRGQA